jgi:predicted transcriptional regulator
MAELSRKATTFRIDPEVQDNLVTLARLEGRPLNYLVNEALRDFVTRRNARHEQDLAASLEKLRAFRRSNPDHDSALYTAAKEAFVDAEATFAAQDPAEGQIVSAEELGPVQTRIHELLHG